MLIQKDNYDFIIENTEAPGINLAIIVINRNNNRVVEMAMFSVRAVDDLSGHATFNTALECLIHQEGQPQEENIILKYNVVDEILKITEKVIKEQDKQ